MSDEKSISILDACWEWNGPRDYHGYGRKTVNRKTVRLHRLAWEWANGPIPPGMFICHRCDNPPCVNPAHLFLGTNLDNVRDMIAKKRHRFFVSDQLETCINGHKYTPENTQWYPGKVKYDCKQCRAEKTRQRYEEERQRLASLRPFYSCTSCSSYADRRCLVRRGVSNLPTFPFARTHCASYKRAFVEAAEGKG